MNKSSHHRKAILIENYDFHFKKMYESLINVP